MLSRLIGFPVLLLSKKTWPGSFICTIRHLGRKSKKSPATTMKLKCLCSMFFCFFRTVETALFLLFEAVSFFLFVQAVSFSLFWDSFLIFLRKQNSIWHTICWILQHINHSWLMGCKFPWRKAKRFAKFNFTYHLVQFCNT
jgi:uncharacterized membrane protein YGL010W